jgi:NDP-sugar pyrophosphorylase family protein
LQGIILAAGKGSRLHPITTTRSKAMLPILGRPIVERVMEMLYRNGVQEFVLVVSENDSGVARYFSSESELKADIRIVCQSERLGMANALQQAAPLIHGDFVLSACDNLVSEDHVADLLAAHRREAGIQGTLSVMRIDESLLGRTGIVDVKNGRVTRILEKPKPQDAPTNIASLPLYVFSPAILDLLPDVSLSARGEYELQDAIQMLIDRHGEVQYVFTTGRLTLTGPGDLLAINRHYLLNGHDRPQLAPYTVGKNTHLITPLRIEEGAVIGEGCVIGPRVYIERNCHIGSNAIIKDAVILRDAQVSDGAMVVGEVIS